MTPPRAVVGAPWVVTVAVIALLAPSCSTEATSTTDATAEAGSLSVVHEDHDESMAIHGALTRVTVRDEPGEIVHEALVPKPDVPERAVGEPAAPRRYDLLRGAAVPAGRLGVRFELRPCGPGGCADDLESDSGGQPPLTSYQDVCEVEIELAAGEQREIVLINDDGSNAAQCRLADPRRGEGPPPQGSLTVIHDTLGEAPAEGAFVYATVVDDEGVPVLAEMVRYPGTPFDPDGPTRHEVLRDAEAPARRWILRVVIWLCEHDCPDAATAASLSDADLRSWIHREELACETEIDIGPGENNELVLVNEGDSYLPACPAG